MDIRTGKAISESASPAVEVPPDRGRPARKKISQKPKRSKSLAARLLVLAKVLALVIMCSAVVVVGFSLYRYAYSTNLLTLQAVRIEGCRHADVKRIEEIIRDDYSSNTLRIDLQSLRARLEQEPWVRRVEIRRMLPATLIVEVQERTPAVIADIGGNLEMLDNEGIFLDHYDTAYGKLDVPVFSGLHGDDPAAYKAFQEDNSARVRIGIQVLAELASGSTEYAQRLSEIDLSDPENVKVLLVDDTAEVYLGNRDFLKRFQMFASNLAYYQEQKAQGKEISAVDLRFEGKIVYTVVPSAAERADVKSKLSRMP